MAQNDIAAEGVVRLAQAADHMATGTRLEKQNFDLYSSRIQMLLGLVAIFCVCIVAYQPILKSGFLLDDFLHVDYVAHAFKGDAHDFLANFTSNWAGSDLMKSYRPLVSLSFAADYAVWRANAFGYHLTNILLLFGCCVFIALITLELTGRDGNKLRGAPPIWAALLFAVYPLHPEATAWIVGRVDLLCTLFYLSSVFFFLRYQQILERQYLAYSIIAFVFAALSKEMAVTLPVVITCAAILHRPVEPPRHYLPAKLTHHLNSKIKLDRNTAQNSAAPDFANDTLTNFLLDAAMIARLTWPYWVALGGIAFVRTHFLGTLIGGYGQSDLGSVIYSLRTFFDRPSLMKIIVPVSEELHLRGGVLQANALLFAAAGGLGIVRSLVCRSNWRPFLLLVLWCVVALLPTFQIWHIYPNLVGSRLFFLSSAPFCILLALLAEPATELLTKRTAGILALIGSIVLSATFLVWTYCLEKNLEPWAIAGQRMTAIKIQLNEIQAKAHGETVSILSLPSDYRGAGMITRSSYLNMLARPPFNSSDISKTFQSIDLVGSPTSDQKPQLAERLRLLSENPRSYLWDEKTGVFVPWQRSKGVGHLVQDFGGIGFATTFSIIPSQIARAQDNSWQVRMADEPYVEQHPEFLRLFTGQKLGPITVLPRYTGKINPLQAQYVVVRCQIHDKDNQLLTDEPGRPTKLSVCWKNSKNASGSTGANSDSPEYEKPLEYVSDNLYIASVGESADWCLAADVTNLGIKCQTGNYVVDLYSMKVGTP